MNFKKVLILLLCVAVLLTACDGRSINGNKRKSAIKANETNLMDLDGLSAKTAYEFNLAYDSGDHQLTGTMKATIVNCSGDSWEKIVINDWATTPYYQTKAYANYAPTDFTDSTVTVGTEVIPVTMQRQSNLSSLDVDAGRTIRDGDTIVFETDFVIHIPCVQNRYGYSNVNGIEQVALGNALPVLGLYKDGEWVTHNYIYNGESFNSEVADYDVTFTCPADYEVVMTGIPEVTDSTYHCVEKCVRDFSIMLATHYETYMEDYKGLLLSIWGNSELSADFPKFAEQTKSIIDFYTELVGPYPYDSIDVCLFDMSDAGAAAGGMEYPELIICNAAQALTEPQALAHEMGHEWFYLSVGNDEFAVPWIDESVTSYISNLYMESLGYDMTGSYVLESYETYYDIIASVDAMADDKYYLMSAYMYGPTFLRDLNELIGDKAFKAALREIYDTYIFRQADTEGVLNIFKKHSPKEFDDLVAQYFKNR